MTRRIAALPLLALSVVATSCASGGSRYPTLAVRPAEGRGWTEPAPPPPAPIAADPALDAQLATTRAALAQDGQRFDVAEARADRLATAAHGQAAGSDKWVAAQSALAELDADRASVGEAASTLEELATARAQALQLDYPALEAVRAQAASLLDGEASRIAALQARLAPG